MPRRLIVRRNPAPAFSAKYRNAGALAKRSARFWVIARRAGSNFATQPPINKLKSANPKSGGVFVMARIIEITVSPKGEVTVQTKGYTGGDCLQATKLLEQALGMPLNVQRTAEFYHPAAAEQRIEQ